MPSFRFLRRKIIVPTKPQRGEAGVFGRFH